MWTWIALQLHLFCGTAAWGWKIHTGIARFSLTNTLFCEFHQVFIEVALFTFLWDLLL